MLALPSSLRVLLTHPLAHRRRWLVLKRFARWQIASRLLGGGFLVDFVGGTRLLVERGMTGATGNIYYGLHEFPDMAIVIHFLRKGDLFADIGANIGSYSFSLPALRTRGVLPTNRYRRRSGISRTMSSSTGLAHW